MSDVLIVDDDGSVRFVFESVLRTAGHNVKTTRSGREALEFVDLQKPDLIVADVRLPDISGIDVLRAVRRHVAQLPVILVTGFANPNDAFEAARLGAAAFLQKPIPAADLLRRVDAALENSASAAGGVRWHAAARWARAVVSVIDSPVDPRTISGWASCAFAASGTLRNWSRIAGMSPRRSLLFARLLRAVLLGREGNHRPENLLDIADQRTLTALLRVAGFEGKRQIPDTIDEFLSKQTLVRDADALAEVQRALRKRRPSTSDSDQNACCKDL